MAGLAYRGDCKAALKAIKIMTFPNIFIYENLLPAKVNLNIQRTLNNYNNGDRELLDTPYFLIKKCQNGPNYPAIKFLNNLSDQIKFLPLPKFKIFL